MTFLVYKTYLNFLLFIYICILCMGMIFLHIVYQVTPLEGSEDAAVTHSTSLKEDTSSSIPVHVENLTSLTPDPEEQEASGTGFENQPLIDTESFSDSYTHIRPSSVSASLPGALEEEEEEEELSQGEDKSELRKTLLEGEKQVTHQKCPSFTDMLNSNKRNVT